MMKAIEEDIENWLKEDDLHRNLLYNKELPGKIVDCKLFIKDDLILSGLPWLKKTFEVLAGKEIDFSIEPFEGKSFKKGEVIEVGKMPFHHALTGERLALNLVQLSSSISTFTSKFVEQASAKNIQILDTRKTTPGLRSIQKYAVRMGGGKNHRFGPSEMWMVKDNHKSFFGGVEEAIQFFKDLGSFYTPIELEVHNLDELKQAFDLNVRHVMLDNFSPDDVREAVKLKKEGVTFEVSGGINLSTLSSYLIEGVDAISVGSLTYGAPPMDISFKIFQEGE